MAVPQISHHSLLVRSVWEGERADLFLFRRVWSAGFSRQREDRLTWPVGPVPGGSIIHHLSDQVDGSRSSFGTNVSRRSSGEPATFRVPTRTRPEILHKPGRRRWFCWGAGLRLAPPRTLRLAPPQTLQGRRWQRESIKASPQTPHRRQHLTGINVGRSDPLGEAGPGSHGRWVSPEPGDPVSERGLRPEQEAVLMGPGSWLRPARTITSINQLIGHSSPPRPPMADLCSPASAFSTCTTLHVHALSHAISAGMAEGHMQVGIRVNVPGAARHLCEAAPQHQRPPRGGAIKRGPPDLNAGFGLNGTLQKSEEGAGLTCDTCTFLPACLSSGEPPADQPLCHWKVMPHSLVPLRQRMGQY